MENKKVLLNGKQIFTGVRIIKKLNIKDDLIRLFGELSSLQKKYQSTNTELLAKLKDKEYTKENIQKVFDKDKELEKKYDQLQTKQENLVFEVVYLIIEHIDSAENEIFKLLAEVYKENAEELKNNPELGEELIPMIIGIIKSESFQKVFSFISK
jgi:DNA-binding transcriptional ArsR family regulator